MKTQDTVEFLKNKLGCKTAPSWLLVLGSGLGSFAENLENPISIPYKDIPGFPVSTVQGHKGCLIQGKFQDQEILILQGRAHMYEGFSVDESVYSLRALKLWGTKNVLLTNAGGGLDPDMDSGSFVIISDQINLTGRNPLLGQAALEWGERFPDMTQIYNLEFQRILETSLLKHKTPYKKGVYCGVLGPSYETPSEVRYLRQIGGSVVGMSTVCEAIAAHHCGLRVAGLSCVTNKASGISSTPLSHKEVQGVASQMKDKFEKVMIDFFNELSGK